MVSRRVYKSLMALQAGGGRQARRPKGPAALAPSPGGPVTLVKIVRQTVAVSSGHEGRWRCRPGLPPPPARVAPPAELARVSVAANCTHCVASRLLHVVRSFIRVGSLLPSAKRLSLSLPNVSSPTASIGPSRAGARKGSGQAARAEHNEWHACGAIRWAKHMADPGCLGSANR